MIGFTQTDKANHFHFIANSKKLFQIQLDICRPVFDAAETI